jgi:gluconate kinase
MKPIVLLSGPVGAGKSTVARELVALSTGSMAYIEGDTFWSFIAKSNERQELHTNFKVIMTAMTAAALPYARADYEVIVDFSFPPWFLNTARRVVLTKGITLDFVVLRPTEAVCAARAAARAEGAIPDYSPYRDLYASFDEAERYTLKDADGEAAVIAARIRDGLDAGIFRVL